MSAKLIEQIDTILAEKRDTSDDQSLTDQRDFYARLIIQTGKDILGYGEKLAKLNVAKGGTAARGDIDAFRRAVKDLAKSLMVALRLDEQVDTDK